MVKISNIQNTTKDIFKYIDLYGIPMLIRSLKRYPFVSWRNNSIPEAGSPTRLSRDIKMQGVTKIKEVSKIILHRNGMTTIKTNLGYFQFFAAGQQVK